ncbi:MAG TPA: hypothetical protein VLF67_04565 [Candidatus Saccharimonas sp.]|nr:hypothetical protein [Candidatus Saccharimonas sp.]
MRGVVLNNFAILSNFATAAVAIVAGGVTIGLVAKKIKAKGTSGHQVMGQARIILLLAQVPFVAVLIELFHYGFGTSFGALVDAGLTGAFIWWLVTAVICLSPALPLSLIPLHFAVKHWSMGWNRLLPVW